MLRLAFAAHAEELTVTSNVRGASILINGLDTGKLTPATLTGLSPGMVQVTVVDRCNRGEMVATVQAGAANKASVMAAEQMATLTVDLTPPEAIVDIDQGKLRVAGGAPVGLPCGAHLVRATLQGHVPFEKELDLVGGQDFLLPIVLKKAGMGSIELSVRPRNATILFDGKPVGTDALTLPSVAEGPHAIGAELDGYAPAEKQIHVDDGDELAYHFELQRASKAQASTVTAVGERPNQDEERRKIEEARRQEQEAERRAEQEREAARRAQEEREADEAAARKAEEQAAREAEEEAAREAEEAAALEAEAAAAHEEEAEEASPEERAALYQDLGGIALIATGVGSGIVAAVSYTPTAEAYETYLAQAERADETGSKSGEEKAKKYYNDTVVPRATGLYAAAIAAPLLIAGGVVLVLIDDAAPVLAPVPGGGMVLWSGRF